MSEQEWLSSDDPRQMLRSLSGKASERKLRLFAVACCRAVWGLVVDPRSQRAVETAELFADDQVDVLALVAASEEAHFAFDGIDRPLDTNRRGDRKTIRAAHLAHLATQVFPTNPHPHNDTAAFVLGTLRDFDFDADAPSGLRHTTLMSGWLRCVFGNPFCLVAFDARWRTADVLGLARAIYDDGAFDRLPLLADALMDAGCADEQIISHCRADGPHVRGCWVVDSILGKG